MFWLFIFDVVLLIIFGKKKGKKNKTKIRARLPKKGAGPGFCEGQGDNGKTAVPRRRVCQGCGGAGGRRVLWRAR